MNSLLPVIDLVIMGNYDSIITVKEVIMTVNE